MKALKRQVYRIKELPLAEIDPGKIAECQYLTRQSGLTLIERNKKKEHFAWYCHEFEEYIEALGPPTTPKTVLNLSGDPIEAFRYPKTSCLQ